MAKAKTWLWIIFGVIALGIMCLFGLAAAGVYFVASHIETDRMSSAEALRAFDARRAEFGDTPPLFELDEFERPRETRQLRDLPTAARRPDELRIMAWDPDEGRIVRVTLPFWMLRLGGRNMEFDPGDHGFQIEQLDLDVEQLARVGSLLIFDLRTPDGERVLIWTQ